MASVLYLVSPSDAEVIRKSRQTMLTDDPDICDHPANLLQVFGSQVERSLSPF